MINSIFIKLLQKINSEQKIFDTLVNADNVLGLNVTSSDIISYMEFTNADRVLNKSILGNIIIIEGDILSVLKIIHDLVYYSGDYILYINNDNIGTITYLINSANNIYEDSNANVHIKIDYNRNYNKYLNELVTIIGSEEFVNTAYRDFKQSNLIIA